VRGEDLLHVQSGSVQLICDRTRGEGNEEHEDGSLRVAVADGGGH
jgi:hypothetical protein